MNKDIILAVNHMFEIAVVDEKFIIFESSGEKVYVLNEEEREILSLFDGMATFNEISKKLHVLYEGDNIAEDFAAYVNTLKEKGILIEKA